MSERVLQPLDYAAPMATPGVVPQFPATAFLFAILGIAANAALVALTVPHMHRAAWAYHDLMQNPRAYGREIAPATIATLRQPIRLWASQGLLIAAASFGLLLGINLLCATVQMHRNPTRASHRLRVYGRLKPIGAAVTALAFLWSGAENHAFWVAATRHWPVGSSEAPYVSSAILFGCAWLPAWWVRNRGGAAAG
jgi:hypothetical protein